MGSVRMTGNAEVAGTLLARSDRSGDGVVLAAGTPEVLYDSEMIAEKARASYPWRMSAGSWASGP